MRETATTLWAAGEISSVTYAGLSALSLYLVNRETAAGLRKPHALPYFGLPGFERCAPPRSPLLS